MKKILWLSLLVSFNASADFPGLGVDGSIISWPYTGGWMQVQAADTYATVDGCEGYVDSCEAYSGSFHVIDHTSGNRQDDIVVSLGVGPNADSQQCETPVEPEPVAMINSLPPRLVGATVYYDNDHFTAPYVFYAVLGWPNVVGADGYDIYRNGQYHASSIGNNDNGGYYFVEDAGLLPSVTFGDCALARIH